MKTTRFLPRLRSITAHDLLHPTLNVLFNVGLLPSAFALAKFFM